MKNLIILILLAVVAYLVYTSGLLNRAVQSVPQLLAGTPNPNETPQISITVYSPYGTGIKSTSAPPNSNAPREPALTLVTPDATSQPIGDVPIFTPPPPTIIVPETPPTLAVPNTPTPSANFTVTLEAPRDGETVNASPLLVKGTTFPNAIVSVNDAVGLAGADGRFALAVKVEPGPNVLEVIASSKDGQQAFVIVTALYQP
jgi:hypothetical protein